MSYEVLCPNGHKLRVEAVHLGKKAKCSKCNVVFVVPQAPPDEAALQAAEHELELSEPVEERAPMPGPSTFPGPVSPSQSSRSSRSGSGAGLLGINMTVAQAMLLVGLVVVLVSRGCDSLGRRAVARAQVAAKMARNRFEDQWQERATKDGLQIEELQNKKDPTAEDTKLLASLRSALDKSRAENEKQRTKLERSEWRDLDIAARDADANNTMMGYWREVLFVLGTVVLTIGLVAVGAQGDTAQRWICLLMLAIITFSIYVGGAAWLMPR